MNCLGKPTVANKLMMDCLKIGGQIYLQEVTDVARELPGERNVLVFVRSRLVNRETNCAACQDAEIDVYLRLIMTDDANHYQLPVVNNNENSDRYSIAN